MTIFTGKDNPKGIMRKLFHWVLFLFFIYLLIRVIFFSIWIMQGKSDHVIGNLGGVPVKIPRNNVHLVEYNKDPHFLEKKWWHLSKRTYESGIRSFGMDVLFPEFRPETNPFESSKGVDIHTSMWLKVGVKSGEAFKADNINGLKHEIDPSHTCRNKDYCYKFVPLPESVFGLTGYTPTGSGVDVRNRDLAYAHSAASLRGLDSRDRNKYFFEDENGKIVTYIQCSNMTHEAAPCTQNFVIAPLKTWVYVGYRKGLLPHWQEIQKGVTTLLYSFTVNANESTEMQNHTTHMKGE